MRPMIERRNIIPTHQLEFKQKYSTIDQVHQTTNIREGIKVHTEVISAYTILAALKMLQFRHIFQSSVGRYVFGARKNECRCAIKQQTWTKAKSYIHE